ncbi:GIY-YIG nuclease family protein [Candidatus Leptofilum sp.]|uniref:GIY-YIG nuclease family protein n=1 Tax=Candidatus Leptofilum sp. TaxID=3241576 RepID=UPI003B5CFE76
MFTYDLGEGNDPNVILPLKRFLLNEQCLEAWQGLDLYLFRDENVVFYIGQSHSGFARVWEHLLSGFKGHSITGRFIWINWPKSMKFTIELLSSQSAQFATVGYDLDAAEQWLIREYSPCFNVSHNPQPTAVPSTYLPPNAKFRRRASLRKLIFEAERVVRAEDNQRWP